VPGPDAGQGIVLGGVSPAGARGSPADVVRLHGRRRDADDPAAGLAGEKESQGAPAAADVEHALAAAQPELAGDEPQVCLLCLVERFAAGEQRAGVLHVRSSRSVGSSAGFRVQMFPGGHFFLHEAPEEFLAAIKKDLVSDGV
jgi:hypothetical protein